MGSIKKVSILGLYESIVVMTLGRRGLKFAEHIQSFHSTKKSILNKYTNNSFLQEIFAHMREIETGRFLILEVNFSAERKVVTSDPWHKRA